MTHYHNTIRRHMGAIGCIDAADPRHIEAWMIYEHGSTLAELSHDDFRAAVVDGIICAIADPANSERPAERERI